MQNIKKFKIIHIFTISVIAFFLIGAMLNIFFVINQIRKQALIEAELKARIMLDYNLAVHMYFNDIMQPKFYEWSAPFRTKGYFDPTWMSSYYALNEMQKYFVSLNHSDYYIKNAAIDARYPQDEADDYERVFLEKLRKDKTLEAESSVRIINGKPYLTVLRKGEVVEQSCLQCHGNPSDAPVGLRQLYGSKSSFHRKAGDILSVISIRIPLSSAYAGIHRVQLELSFLLAICLAVLLGIQFLLYKHFFISPVNTIRDKAWDIAKNDYLLGEKIPELGSRDFNEVADAFNAMSEKLKISRDQLENRVKERSRELEAFNKQLTKEVAERKVAEGRLLMREAYLHAIMNNVPYLMWLKDTDGRFLAVNNLFAHSCGRNNEEDVIGKTDLDVWPVDLANKYRSDDAEVMATGENKNVEEPIADQNTIKWFETFKAPILDHDGRLIGTTGISRDITQRKQAEMDRKLGADHLRKALGETVQAIATLVETRDAYTAGHQRRVSDLARAIAAEMGLSPDQIDGIGMASTIHDIGKISVPVEILTKPTKLTDIEFSLIKAHAQSGYEILKDIEFPWPIARMVMEHHERINGSGYPNGLTGEKLLIESRILSVADVVEAMASYRPYRPGQGIKTALGEITKNKGIIYDSEVVDACLRLFNDKDYQMEG